MTEIYEKWGFGMAPPKPATEAERQAAVAHLLEIFGRTLLPGSDAKTLDACSTVKGMFNRIVREDQWDWFTVCSQLAFPNRLLSKSIAQSIHDLRDGIKRADEPAFIDARDKFLRLRAHICLEVFLGRRQLQQPEDAGWIYVMSSREMKDVLKVGMTRRNVFEREINSATGVVIPFGVRRCWCVTDAAHAEKLAHEALVEYRMRGDREFFRVGFEQAAVLIRDAIRDAGLEIPVWAATVKVDRGVVAGL